MKFDVVHGSLTEQSADVLIVNLFEGVKSPGGGTGAIDGALGGQISEVIREEGFEGKLGEITMIRSQGKIPAGKVLLVGLGKSDGFGITEIMRAAGAAARKCRQLRAGTVASILHGAGIAGIPARDCARAVVLGTILGTYEYTRLKTEGVKENSIQEFSIVELSEEKLPEIERGMRYAEVVGDAVTWARDLANDPSNVTTPSSLADAAQEIAREHGMSCRVRDRKGIEDAGMGLIAAVARGSAVEPRFIELRYESQGAGKTIALVGKGVTFDSGGYSLKTPDSMYGMKDDMSGAAVVLAVMRALGRLKPNVNVLALIPAVENMIGGGAIHPGDVFKSYGGKTVEVNNTDAEGRLIVSDAVAYAREQGVDEIIDLATLTGACVIALGREMAGIFSSSDELANRLIEAGSRCGEKLWRLPLHSSYKEYLKSDVADMKNTGPREGAAINGALFIGEFVGDVPWAHIDLSSSSIDKDTDLAKKGATGYCASTLIEYIAGE
jgi:leucyl aminopeptidase